MFTSVLPRERVNIDTFAIVTNVFKRNDISSNLAINVLRVSDAAWHAQGTGGTHPFIVRTTTSDLSEREMEQRRREGGHKRVRCEEELDVEGGRIRRGDEKRKLLEMFVFPLLA